MWDDRSIVVPCGGAEPVDRMPIERMATKARVMSVPSGSLAGWVSRGFNSSCAIGGKVDAGSGDAQEALFGTLGGPVEFGGER